MNGGGNACVEWEAELRRQTLAMCHASGRDYEVILTSGATAALHLVRKGGQGGPAALHLVQQGGQQDAGMTRIA